MSISLYLLMPLSKQAFENPANTRKALDLLVQKGLVSLDMPTAVWSYPYDEDEGDFGEEKLPQATLGELRDALDGIRTDEINFDAGFSRYSPEYKVREGQGRLPGINALTAQLQDHMGAFCEENDIDYTLDVYGKVSIGFMGADGEDGLGEIRGIGVFCDGNVAPFMEDGGYLEAAKTQPLYAVFEQLAAIYGEAPTLQFRG
jgi:hypothetical protein